MPKFGLSAFSLPASLLFVLIGISVAKAKALKLHLLTAVASSSPDTENGISKTPVGGYWGLVKRIIALLLPFITWHEASAAHSLSGLSHY